MRWALSSFILDFLIYFFAKRLISDGINLANICNFLCLVFSGIRPQMNIH